MAVIQKKTNELESMMASFAVIPDFEKAGTDPKKDKRLCDLYGLWELLVLRDFTFSRSFLDCHDFGNSARLCGG